MLYASFEVGESIVHRLAIRSDNEGDGNRPESLDNGSEFRSVGGREIGKQWATTVGRMVKANAQPPAPSGKEFTSWVQDRAIREDVEVLLSMTQLKSEIERGGVDLLFYKRGVLEDGVPLLFDSVGFI